jgi:hypothetical protein
LLPLLAAMLLAPPAVDPVVAALIRETGRVCRNGAPIQTEEQLASMLPILGSPDGVRYRDCRRDPALAIRAALALAAAPSASSAPAMLFLGGAAAAGVGMPRDPAVAEAWYLRASALDERLFISSVIPQARRDAFLASDEAIAMLRDRLRRGSPPREQLRLATALVLRHAPGDLDEAAALAMRDPSRDAQRLRLQIAHGLLAGSPSTTRDATAAALLTGAVSALQFDPASRASALALGSRRLQAARTPAERAAAIELLAAAAVAAEPEAVASLNAALRRENGGRDPAVIEAPPAMKIAIAPDDYPPAALRAESQGVVRLWALVDPAGRVVAMVPTGPDQPALLVDTVRRLFARRGPAAVAPPPVRPTPWLRMKLPSVAFTIRG